MQVLINIYSLFLFCCLFSVSVNSEIVNIKGEEFIIRYGLMQKEGDKHHVYKQTSNILLISKSENPDYKFGYTIKSKNNSNFEFYHVMYVPKSAEYKSQLPLQVKNMEEYDVLRFKPQAVGGYSASALRFNEGDNPGEYKFEIFINDELAKTIVFDVSRKK